MAEWWQSIDVAENELVVFKLNEAELKIRCFQGIAMELNEAFSFQMDGYKFSPLFKMGRWDGYIRIFGLGKRTLPSGLFENLQKFCDERNYTLRVIHNQEVKFGLPGATTGITNEEVIKYANSLDIHARGVKLDIYEYQYRAMFEALSRKACILWAATSAGKSMIVYVISRYLTEQLGKRVLILVPTVGLTTQFFNDFKDYSGQNGYDVQNSVHLISAGIEKGTKKSITVSTYQSLANEDTDYFNSFDCILTDEGHKITADSFKKIYGKATEVEYRLACTGTLQELKCNLLQMIGLTGPVVKVVTAAELIEAGRAVPLKIKAIQLNYDQEWCAAMKKADYDQEITWLTLNPRRNKFIAKLAHKTKGTTLVMFNFIDHGNSLLKVIQELSDGTRPIYIINGSVKAIEREAIRLGANEEDCIILASIKTMSAGINLPAIENIIYCHPTKGKIQYIQTIGRGIRLKAGKTHCNFYDIGDNLTYKRKPNNTFRHFGIRLETLAQEGHEFDTVMVDFS